MLFKWSSFDIILADQVSVVVPLLKLKKSTKVIIIHINWLFGDPGTIAVSYKILLFAGFILLSFS